MVLCCSLGDRTYEKPAFVNYHQKFFLEQALVAEEQSTEPPPN